MIHVCHLIYLFISEHYSWSLMWSSRCVSGRHGVYSERTQVFWWFELRRREADRMKSFLKSSFDLFKHLKRKTLCEFSIRVFLTCICFLFSSFIKVQLIKLSAWYFHRSSHAVLIIKLQTETRWIHFVSLAEYLTLIWAKRKKKEPVGE